MNEIPIRETFQRPQPSIRVGNIHGSAAGTSVTADLPPTAAGSLSHIEGQTLNVPQAATGSLGPVQYSQAMEPRPTTPPAGVQMAVLLGASSPAAMPVPARRSPFGAFAGATPPTGAEKLRAAVLRARAAALPIHVLACR